MGKNTDGDRKNKTQRIKTYAVSVQARTCSRDTEMSLSALNPQQKEEGGKKNMLLNTKCNNQDLLWITALHWRTYSVLILFYQSELKRWRFFLKEKINIHPSF